MSSHHQSNDSDGNGLTLNTGEGDSDSPVELYSALNATGQQIAETLKKAVVTPVAKQHFENDRGHPVTQVLPDRTENYDFDSHGFEALVLPDERRVVNESYNGKIISRTTLLRDPELFGQVFEQAKALWVDTFGEHKRHVTQSGHPGPFPFSSVDIPTIAGEFEDSYTELLDSQSLTVAAEAARDDNLPILADLFDTTPSEIIAPGGTDLSALARTDEVHVPYNDGKIAVLCPTSENTSTSTPTRGVIIGYDDTPTGMFAHVTDVTNLSPTQETTHTAIRDAMGFDRELNPYVNHDSLEAAPGERIRLQGDLRVERTDDLDGFAEELSRNTRLREYRALVDEVLDGVELPSNHVRGRRGAPAVTTVLNPTVTPNGSVMLDPDTSDGELELLAYVTVLCEVEEGPAGAYDEYDDIPYINDPASFREPFGRVSLAHAIENARDETRETVEHVVQEHRDTIEELARDQAAEAKAAIDVPQQVNIPVDNHMTFLEAGFAPDVETEPVPVAVPEKTTLHIVHDEHNSVTIQVSPGVYRFSLLPRGLQLQGDRAQWPSP